MSIQTLIAVATVTSAVRMTYQVVHADNKLKPLIEELKLFPNKTSYRSLRTCDLELELTHENKGIESIQFYDAGEKGTQFANTHV